MRTAVPACLLAMLLASGCAGRLDGGDPMPDFRVTAADGSVVTDGSMAGRPAIIDILAVREVAGEAVLDPEDLPALRDLVNQTARWGDRVAVLTALRVVNGGTVTEAMLLRLRADLGATWPFAVVGDRFAVKFFGAEPGAHAGFDGGFIFDADGIVVAKGFSGAGDPACRRQVVDTLLEGTWDEVYPPAQGHPVQPVC